MTKQEELKILLNILKHYDEDLRITETGYYRYRKNPNQEHRNQQFKNPQFGNRFLIPLIKYLIKFKQIEK